MAYIKWAPVASLSHSPGLLEDWGRLNFRQIGSTTAILAHQEREARLARSHRWAALAETLPKR